MVGFPKSGHILYYTLLGMYVHMLHNLRNNASPIAMYRLLLCTYSLLHEFLTPLSYTLIFSCPDLCMEMVLTLTSSQASRM